MSKYLYIISICCGLIDVVYGQQDEHYIQYTENKFLLNPAAFTPQNHIGISSLARWQSPNRSSRISSQSISIQTPIRYNSIGFGGSIRNDQQPGLHALKINIASSYRIKLFKGLLAFGIDGGVLNTKMDYFNFLPKDINDPNYDPNDQKWGADLGYGVYYSNDRLYFGLSNKHTNNIIIGTSNQTIGEKYRYYIISGYNHNITSHLNLSYNAVLRKTYFDKPQWVFNSVLKYNQLVSFGAGISSDKEWNIQIGLSLNKALNRKQNSGLNIGYAFQGAIIADGLSYGSTHEIMCIMNLYKRKSIKSIKASKKYIN